MRISKLQRKLQAQGFILIPDATGYGFVVTNSGIKQPFDQHFNNVDEVNQWFASQMQHNNRLTEEQCAQWDVDYKEFCENQKNI